MVKKHERKREDYEKEARRLGLEGKSLDDYMEMLGFKPEQKRPKPLPIASDFLKMLGITGDRRNRK